MSEDKIMVPTVAAETSPADAPNAPVTFEAFPKISRLKRQIVITEKIDGTNAQVYVTEDGQVLAGSRSRWITPEDDNFGFARWVAANTEELHGLGPGRHYGEWWGSGIQRAYGYRGGERFFSLFNTSRWTDERRPACCGVVPVLYHGEFTTTAVDMVLEGLANYGSQAAKGFMNPEGIIVFHSAANLCFKRTIKKDDEPKSLDRAA